VVGKNYRLQNIQLSKNTLGLVGQVGKPTARQACGRLAENSLAFRPLPASALARSGEQKLLNWLTNRRSPPSSCRAKVGGEYRARTGDLLVANQALSQLS